ncbi:MAG: ABC transporter permease, partial [Flammeovirgaceae bacterium]
MAYPLLYQKEGRPLSQPFEIVITKEFASRFFLDPKLAIGAKLKLLSREFNVIAIADDPPVNTHLHFDFIVSRRTIEVPQDDIDYTKSNYITYIQLFKGKSPQNIIDGLEAMEKVIFEFPDLYDIYLQPLSSIHQGSVNMVHDPLDARKTSPLNVAFELI